MISDAERARAVPMPWLVSRDIPLRKSGAVYQGKCPFHADATPSFTVYRDHYFCFGCSASGDAITWIRRTRGLDFESAVRELIGGWQPKELRTQPSTPPRHERAPRPPRQAPSSVLELWDRADAPRLAEFYLWSRGIGQKSLPEALRGHRRVWCEERREHRPAMLAAIIDAGGRLRAVQRTWLEDRLEYDGHTEFPKGARCVDLSAGKKCLGPLGAGAVRLAAAGEVLGLAEGVESALAAAKLFRLPVWATCGAHRLGQVELPQCVRHVVIFGDADEAGRAAASKAEHAYRLRGYSAQSAFPESGKDWAGMIL